MIPVSDMNAGAARPLAAAERALGAPGVREPGGEAQGRPLKPVTDEYVPEQPREPSGRYWMGRDEEGQPRIYFDDPARAADASGGEKPEQAAGPERKEEGEETWKCSTDQVDREIEKLKKKRQELERQLSAEDDQARIKVLERQLSQVERELKRKDNDTYRRQHAAFTRLS